MSFSEPLEGLLIRRQLSFGTWTCQVSAFTVKDALERAKSLDSYLRAHPLPSVTGLLVVDMAGDGQHTTAKWAQGQYMYRCFGYRQSEQTVDMVESMRPYPHS
jgi:hypothetical protein